MLPFIAQAGYATTVINFTNNLSSLLAGLIGVTAMIVVEILHVHTLQKTHASISAISTATVYRQAA